MNILFFGLGSIGQRHIRNIKKFWPDYNIYAYRQKNIVPLLNLKNNKVKGSVEKKYKIISTNYLDFFRKKKIQIDAAFICTPSSMHVNNAIWCIKKNIPVFIEKPVATNLKDLNKINKAIRNKKSLINVVGYQLRFNPIIKFIKNFCFENEKLGKIFSCEIYHGEHVDSFHSYESYKDSYTSKKKLGGGVSLTQIHEIDYLNFFLENYKFIDHEFMSEKISKLEIDVEDIYTSIFKYQNKINKNFVLAKITCSYLQIPKKRDIFISCEHGSIYADLNTMDIKIKKKNKKNILKKFKINKNNIFIDEIKYFLNLVKKTKQTKKILPNIIDDRDVNKIAIKMKI